MPGRPQTEHPPPPLLKAKLSHGITNCFVLISRRAITRSTRDPKLEAAAKITTDGVIDGITRGLYLRPPSIRKRSEARS